MTDFVLEFLPPPPALVDTVTLFYDMRSPRAYEEFSFRAHNANLCFVLEGSDGLISYSGGKSQPMYDVHILGQGTATGKAWGNGPIWLFGLGLTPLGWAQLMPMDASFVVNQTLDATEIFGNKLRDAREMLLNAPSLTARIGITARVIKDLRNEVETSARAFMDTVNTWLSSSLSPDINALMESTGLSGRQIARNCKRFYGVTPKMLVRKYRALRAASRIVNGHDTHFDLISEGFYDQSHLNRELKYFTGHTARTICDDSDLQTLISKLKASTEGHKNLLRSI